tara:strand:+ start:765 stop:1277 length:513 start_codon:yes stop_codon:yes gene_type:complete
VSNSKYDPLADFNDIFESSTGPEEGAEGETAIVEDKPPIPQVLPDDESSPSMLSTQVLQQLAEAPEGLPAAFLKQAAPHFHKTQSIVDFAATVCVAVAEGKLKTSQSAELRKWAELMYTCVVANEPQQNNVQVNYVEQLIQLAGGEKAVQPDVLDVREAITSPRKKAQGE